MDKHSCLDLNKSLIILLLLQTLVTGINAQALKKDYSLDSHSVRHLFWHEMPDEMINFQYDSISDILKGLVRYCIREDSAYLDTNSPMYSEVILRKVSKPGQPDVYSIKISIFDDIDFSLDFYSVDWGVSEVDGMRLYILDRDNSPLVGKMRYDNPVKNSWGKVLMVYDGGDVWSFVVKGDNIYLKTNWRRNFSSLWANDLVPISLNAPLPDLNGKGKEYWNRLKPDGDEYDPNGDLFNYYFFRKALPDIK